MADIAIRIATPSTGDNVVIYLHCSTIAVKIVTTEWTHFAFYTIKIGFQMAEIWPKQQKLLQVKGLRGDWPVSFLDYIN